MRVKMLSDKIVDGVLCEAGEIVEMSALAADVCLRRGIAEKVDEAAEVPAEEPAEAPEEELADAPEELPEEVPAPRKRRSRKAARIDESEDAKASGACDGDAEAGGDDEPAEDDCLGLDSVRVGGDDSGEPDEPPKPRGKRKPKAAKEQETVSDGGC